MCGIYYGWDCRGVIGKRMNVISLEENEAQVMEWINDHFVLNEIEIESTKMKVLKAMVL